MVKFKNLWVVAGLFLVLSLSEARAAPETDKPIRIILNNWTSQIVMSYILGSLYTDKGYQVEYETLAIKDQWGRLHRGLAHVQVEVWEGTMAEDFDRVLKFGQVKEVGDHDAKTREEWWYPAYVEEVCPGLPDWKALRGCASLFANDQTHPRGRYVAGPWEKPERARIRALDMDFEVDAVAKSDDLWAALAEAYSKEKPIVLFNWSPNWVEDRFEGRFVEFPDYDPACESDHSWGINPERPYDCGNPKDGWLKKGAWVGFQESWPCAHAILSDMNFDNAMISAVAALVDADGMDHQAAAQKWLSENRSVWEGWGRSGCTG